MKFREFNKYYFIIFCILFYENIEIFLQKKTIEKLLFYIQEKDIYQMFFTFYKGEKIMKSKLINDYLSKVSDDYIFDKQKEKQRLDI